MSATILTRSLSASQGLSAYSSPASFSNQVDALVTGFIEEAANPKTLAALVAGGVAYRVGRIGVLGMGSSAVFRPLSVAGGLGLEVTAFEFTTRTLVTFSSYDSYPQGHRRDTLHASRRWSWSGTGGWREGLASSAITFGLLKGAGFLGREQNIVLQHAFQSTAMVAGHNAAGVLRITPTPEGTLAEQLLHAEAMNLQLNAGMALAHHLAPGFHALERSLELSLSSKEGHPLPRLNSPGFFFHPPILAAVGDGRPSSRANERPEQVNLFAMSGKGGGDRVIEYKLKDYEDLAERAASDVHVLDYLRILAEAGDSLAIQALALAATNGNPKAVFVLRNFVQDGDPMASILLRNLDITQLVRAAPRDPEATWALHYLEEIKNVDAIQVMSGLDLADVESEWVVVELNRSKGPPN